MLTGGKSLASPVTLVRLRHISRFRDRHGHWRHYLRVPGQKAISLPGTPGSPVFMAAYHAGLVATAAPTARVADGTLDALAVSYYRSAGWAVLGDATRRKYRGIIEALRAQHGVDSFALLDAKGVRGLITGKQEHPAAANHLLRIIRQLAAHAMELGWRDTDPTMGVKRLRQKVKGFTPWTEGEIAAYEAHHPSGTRPRLALGLLLATGQRRSDVVRMGWQHVRRGEDGQQRIEVRQVKTGAHVLVPIHPLLAIELAHVPRDRLTFLVTEAGPAFTPNNFYMRFRDWCDAAGIPPGRSPHGLRKACGRRLAEAGCTAFEVGSILGHTSLGEMQKYTADMDRARLATTAMGRISNVVDFQPGAGVGKRGRKIGV